MANTVTILKNDTGKDTIVELVPNERYYIDTKGTSEITLTVKYVSSLFGGGDLDIYVYSKLRNVPEETLFDIPLINTDSGLVRQFFFKFEAGNSPDKNGLAVPIPINPGIERLYFFLVFLGANSQTELGGFVGSF